MQFYIVSDVLAIVTNCKHFMVASGSMVVLYVFLFRSLVSGNYLHPNIPIGLHPDWPNTQRYYKSCYKIPFYITWKAITVRRQYLIVLTFQFLLAFHLFALQDLISSVFTCITWYQEVDIVQLSIFENPISNLKKKKEDKFSWECLKKKKHHFWKVVNKAVCLLCPIGLNDEKTKTI